MEHLVFVYGTLKKGFGNHRLLSHCEMLSQDAATRGHMFSLGGFPGMKPVERSPIREQDAVHNLVHGEIYRVDDATLARLDRLEGHPRMYIREEVDVELSNGTAFGRCWAYFYNGNVAEREFIILGKW